MTYYLTSFCGWHYSDSPGQRRDIHRFSKAAIAACGILVAATCSCVDLAAEESQKPPNVANTWEELSQRCWRVGAEKLNLGDQISSEDLWEQDTSSVGSILVLLRRSVVAIPDKAGPAVALRIKGLDYSNGDWLVRLAAASVPLNVTMRMRASAEKAVIAVNVSEKPLSDMAFPGLAPSECEYLWTCYPVAIEYVLRKLDVLAQDDVPHIDLDVSHIKAEIRSFQRGTRE